MANWFNNPSQFQNLELALARKGFNSDEVSQIIGKNWLNLFRLLPVEINSSKMKKSATRKTQQIQLQCSKPPKANTRWQ